MSGERSNLLWFVRMLISFLGEEGYVLPEPATLSVQVVCSPEVSGECFNSLRFAQILIFFG